MFNSRSRDEYERLARDSFEGTPHLRPTLEPFDIQEDTPNGFSGYKKSHRGNSLWPLICFPFSFAANKCGRKIGRGGRWRRLVARGVMVTTAMVLMLLVITPIWDPSYTIRPLHYTGSNPLNETVFIAANIVDEDLIRGVWGRAMLGLIERIGPERVFLSIYENDSGPGTKAALKELAEKVKCESSIVSGHVDLDAFPSIRVLPDDSRVKRIAYLAHVRNKALEPLEALTDGNADETQDIKSTDRVFDKLLFVNDVVFSPEDAMDLLFSTNLGVDGRTNYHSACAVDFINAFKFYDRFAMRDAEGFRTGVPFFPWFTKEGQAESWNDVMRGTDSVRVQSCWGGMVAFEAKWFQSKTVPGASKGLKPLRFRHETELFWDASECCLIQADLSHLVQETAQGLTAPGSGIYVNPFIRVAYDERSFWWLGFTRRFERLYTFPHTLVDMLIRAPTFCSRRLDAPGQEVSHPTWVYDEPIGGPQGPVDLTRIKDFGHWDIVKRVAKPGGFCGYRRLLALKKKWEPGQKIWETIEAPPH